MKTNHTYPARMKIVKEMTKHPDREFIGLRLRPERYLVSLGL